MWQPPTAPDQLLRACGNDDGANADADDAIFCVPCDGTLFETLPPPHEGDWLASNCADRAGQTFEEWKFAVGLGKRSTTSRVKPH